MEWRLLGTRLLARDLPFCIYLARDVRHISCIYKDIIGVVINIVTLCTSFIRQDSPILPQVDGM